MRLRLVLIFIFALGVGCTQKGTPFSKNEGPRPSVDGSLGEPTDQSVENNLSAQSSSLKDLKTLADWVLRRAVVGDPQVSHRDATKAQLARLNKMLLDAATAHPGSAEVGYVAAKYQTLLMAARR